MDLAFATGHGPKLLTNLESRCPLVRSEDVFVFGFRDADEQAEYGTRDLAAGNNSGWIGYSILQRSVGHCACHDGVVALSFRLPLSRRVRGHGLRRERLGAANT